MSDIGTRTSCLTLEALASEIADLRARRRTSWTIPRVSALVSAIANARSKSRRALRAKSVAQEAEIARLRGGSTQVVTADRPPSPSQASTSATSIDSRDLALPLGDEPVSRRGALRALGGVAAGGVGLALGSTLLGAEPAAAANPSLILDQSNPVTAATTLTGSTSSDYLLYIEGTDGGLYVSGPGVSGVDLGVYFGTITGDSGGAGVGLLGLSRYELVPHQATFARFTSSRSVLS
jgi:hypothetical protein